MPLLLDRPVFIMAAPRSCSTLLFEAMSRSAHLWSIGDESHQLIEQFSPLNPLAEADSNRVTAEVLEGEMGGELGRSLRRAFTLNLRDRNGARPPAEGTVRLLEKTPKNALRIPFLAALYPDARFIHLVRDPKENIASMIDAWRSRRFVTYPSIATANGPWSLLLPPGWRDRLEAPLEEVAAFQWQAANQHILDDLAAIPRERRCTLNASELLADPRAVAERLCRFIDIPMDEEFASGLMQPLPLSMYTLHAPRPDKWRRHGGALQRVWPRIAPLIDRLNASLDAGTPPLDAAGPPPDAVDASPDEGERHHDPHSEMGDVGRNSPCPCGSGRRFKTCHGRLT
jgi:hypothetical protein